mmetsp:Transcript_96965/g.224779  ORF Transcript_96965/g.224779 Transcript_96965/m.224779 type:complete len:102 (+) Transcript_96965:1313-1618(+)
MRFLVCLALLPVLEESELFCKIAKICFTIFVGRADPGPQLLNQGIPLTQLVQRSAVGSFSFVQACLGSIQPLADLLKCPSKVGHLRGLIATQRRLAIVQGT